jgi:hypothetical protein
MPSEGFEPTNSAGERPQTNALDRAATGTGVNLFCSRLFVSFFIYRKVILALVSGAKW